MEHICKKCGERISYSPNVVFCDGCGRTYHSWCWKSLPSCPSCGLENKEYSPEVAERVPKLTEEQERKKGCHLCENALGLTDTVKCPECGKLYHRHCSLKTDKCTACGCASVNFVKVDNVVSYSTNYVQDSGMFADVGEKIKNLATFVTVIGIIAGVIVFIVNAAMGTVIPGLLIGLAIGVGAWIGSFAMYGFGALISSSQNTERLLSELINEIKKDNLK